MPRYSLKRAALVQDQLARALVGAGEQVADHHRAGADGQRLDDVAGVADAAVGDHRHVVPRRRLRALVHRRDHRHADAGDDAGGADRAGADADLDARRRRARSAPRWPRRWRRCRRSSSTSGKVRRSVAHHVEHALASGRARCRPPARRRARRPAPRRAPRVSRAMPTAAPQRSRPSESLQALGYLIAFWMSLTVIRPFSRKSWSTTSSFSTLCWCRISRASSSVVPTGTVIRLSLVITSATGRSMLVSKRRSRLVRMPTSRPSLLPSSVIGTPEMR